jgi:hypothetical protein
MATKKIIDERIGIKHLPDYAILKRPTRLIDGTIVTKSFVAATVWQFGSKKQYFVYLPNNFRMTNELITELYEIVGESQLATNKTPVVTVKENVVPVLEVESLDSE